MTVQEWLGADNTLGIDIWEKKYRFNNESFDQWLDRVSNGDEKIKSLIIEKKFLFGGRILANRGIQKIDPSIKTTYSNCYVTSVEDNLESIFDCAKKIARTFSYGGGIGVDLSNLAPKGAKVRNAAKESSGAVSFMDMYSDITGLISQGGRRGALMLSLSCDHPDIEEFIDIKKDLDRVTKANISVRVTDEFMNAVVNDEPFTLSFVRDATGERIEKTVNARELMKKIAYNNWDMGEPGVLFWDRIEGWTLLSEYDNFKYAGVNPCAEEPLPNGGSCLLSAINLSEYVENGSFNFYEFSNDIYYITKAMNDVLDEGLMLHPLVEQQNSVRDWRQIGIGVMGVADMLIKMGIVYGSDESVELCDRIASTLIDQTALSSCTLARINGSSFPKYNSYNTQNSNFCIANLNNSTQGAIEVFGLYNSQLLTIAPTGSISTMIEVSGGLEPNFANSYTRKTQSLHGEDVYYTKHTKLAQEYMSEHGITSEDELPDYFITSKDIPYENRIKMQAVWQKHIDASISSTVNLPFDSTPDDVFNIYVEAWKAGLKGITVFRDGCRRASILTTTPKKDNNSEEKTATDSTNELPRGYIIDASDSLVGKKRKLTTGCGSLHVTAFFDPITGDLMETYLSKGSTGGCANSLTGISRLISLSARAGCSVETIADQLESCGVCPSYAVRSATKHDTSRGSSCPVAVGKALVDMWKEMQDEIGIYSDDEDTFVELNDHLLNFGDKNKNKTAISKKAFSQTHMRQSCPECNEPIVHEGGCDICKNCGWSKCN